MNLILKQKLKQGKSFNLECSLLNLDEEGIKELIEESYFSILDHKQRGGKKLNGNFIHTKAFYDILKKVKEKNKNEKSFSLEFEDSNYRIKDLRNSKNKFEEELSNFSSEEKRNPNNCFTNSLKNVLNYGQKIQKEITEFVCNYQKEFIQTMDISKMKPLKQEDVSKETGIDLTTVNKAIQNLNLNIPEIPFEFNIKELISGYKFGGIQIKYALSQMKENEKLYGNEEFKIKNKEIGRILREEYGLEVSDRSVRNYTRLFIENQKARNKDSDNEVQLYNEVYQELDLLESNPSLCVDGKWKVGIKGLTNILKKELDENITQNMLENIVETKNWNQVKNYSFPDYKI
ncbi:MAG: hypothetical protein ACOCUT_00430 [bacterium]